MASRDSARPNVLLILADGQDAGAPGGAGIDEIRTPNLDALAQRGVVFSRFFCASPVSSPARASLFTGLLPSQHGVRELLPDRHAREPDNDLSVGRLLFTDLLADAERFLETEAAITDTPFYLSLHFTDPSSSRAGACPGEHADLYQEGAFTSCADTAIGRVLRRLDELGLTESTLVIFSASGDGNGWAWAMSAQPACRGTPSPTCSPARAAWTTRIGSASWSTASTDPCR